ncbi:MAG: hypothetical protein A2202_06560 [Bdellovibrionales bacterium RIFOXYA1_FULL_36_14]|nr:MAG: hypothetical protein A2202_06560 [Bdellovibrionales bacterium RIFOXYA1_FULL_36_14]
MKQLKNKKDDFKSGQSIVEFMIFLPLIMIIFLMTITISASINGSINQLKATRGYFYFLTKGNSRGPFVQDLATMIGKVDMVGVHVLGWYNYAVGVEAVAPCYSLQSLITSQASDVCENTSSISGKNAKSKFIRPFTVYGVCSAYVYKINNQADYTDMSGVAWSSGYCARRK